MSSTAIACQTCGATTIKHLEQEENDVTWSERTSDCSEISPALTQSVTALRALLKLLAVLLLIACFARHSFAQSIAVDLETVGPMSSRNQAAWWSPIVVDAAGAVYVSYLGPNSPSDDVMIAKRTGDDNWAIADTTFNSAYDPGHTQTSLAIDGDGTLHMFYGMHNHPIRYLQSNAPNSVTDGFTKLNPAAFSGSFTYPNVTSAPNGDLYSIIRNSNVNSFGELHHFDNSTNTWAELPSFAHQSGATVYPDHVITDSAGDVHIVWEWAADGPQASRHFGTYARYDPDTSSYYRADGSAYQPGPATIANGDIWQGLEGSETFTFGVHGVQSAKMTLDSQGFPIITYGYSLDGTSSGYEHRLARWTGAVWQVSTVTPGPFDSDKSWITYSDGSLRFYGTLSPSDPLHSGSDDIFLRVSDDLGRNWSDPVPITNGLNIQRPVGTTVDGVDYLYLPSVDTGTMRVAIVEEISALNTLVLQIDPFTGVARIRNNSTMPFSIDGYTVFSDDAALFTTWNSLDDQSAAGGDWREANPTPSRISEIKEAGSLQIESGESFDLGMLVDTSLHLADDHLRFQFLIDGEVLPTSGLVVFDVFGDFDTDRDVDGLDFLAWQRGLSPVALSSVDLDDWASGYGTAAPVFASAVKVPEPSSIGVVLVLSIMWMLSRTCAVGKLLRLSVGSK